MTKDYKDQRAKLDAQFHNHTRIEAKTILFVHRPCKGTTKLNLPCSMPAGLDNYCRIHRNASS